MRPNYIVIYITAPSRKEARGIVSGLIRKRLIACGNIIEGVESVFTWKGRVQKAKETLIICKTRTALFKKIAAEVRQLHSYEVPEIIAVPVAEGSGSYLKWIDEVTCRGQK